MNDKYINQCNVKNCWYMKHVYIFYCKLINVSFLVETKKGTTSEKESKKQDFDPFSLDLSPPTINRDTRLERGLRENLTPKDFSTDSF